MTADAAKNVDVRVTRVIEAPAERVFDAWLDAATAWRFLFATDTGEMVRAEVDPRVGGRFVFTDRRDGKNVEHAGEYVEIDRPRRVVFDFTVTGYSSQQTRMTVEVTSRGEASEVAVTQDDVPPEFVERTKNGWTHIVDGLAAVLRA